MEKLQSDWTKLKSTDIDVPAFIKRLERMREGAVTQCPFCEDGKVFLMEQDGEKNVFGCDCCDMRIETECHCIIA